MRRLGAALLLLVLLTGCGKYGRPRRVPPERLAPVQVEAPVGAESPADEDDAEKAP
jgi:predicted small lipoprotein YifL